MNNHRSKFFFKRISKTNYFERNFSTRWLHKIFCISIYKFSDFWRKNDISLYKMLCMLWYVYTNISEEVCWHFKAKHKKIWITKLSFKFIYRHLPSKTIIDFQYLSPLQILKYQTHFKFIYFVWLHVIL